jgi:hypothetical protein
MLRDHIFQRFARKYVNQHCNAARYLVINVAVV